MKTINTELTNEEKAKFAEISERETHELNDFERKVQKDAGFDNLDPQLQAMEEKYPEYFEFSEDPEKGNLHFEVKEDAVHAYEEVYHHVWNYLPYLFK